MKKAAIINFILLIVLAIAASALSNDVNGGQHDALFTGAAAYGVLLIIVGLVLALILVISVVISLIRLLINRSSAIAESKPFTKIFITTLLPISVVMLAIVNLYFLFSVCMLLRKNT